MSTQIDLDALTLDEDLQPREEIDTRVLEEYAHLLGDGVSFPPVVVFFDGATRWLADGYHRWHAHKALGLAEIAMDMRLGSKKDALLHSLSANAEHGKQRGYGDFRKAYEIITRNELCEPWNADKVRELLKCSMSRAYELTEDARKKREHEKKREDQAAVKDGLSAGKTQRQIAEETGISKSTVDRLAPKFRSENLGQLAPAPEATESEHEAERLAPVSNAWIDWISAVRHIAESKANLAAIARPTPSLRPKLLEEARAALPRLKEVDRTFGETDCRTPTNRRMIDSSTRASAAIIRAGPQAECVIRGFAAKRGGQHRKCV